MLSQRIRMLRLSQKMSQVELAHLLGVTKQSVSNWENDNIQPSVDMVIKIAKVFTVSTDYLLGLNRGEYLDISDLPEELAFHIRLIVNDLRR